MPDFYDAFLIAYADNYPEFLFDFLEWIIPPECIADNPEDVNEYWSNFFQDKISFLDKSNVAGFVLPVRLDCPNAKLQLLLLTKSYDPNTINGFTKSALVLAKRILEKKIPMTTNTVFAAALRDMVSPPNLYIDGIKPTHQQLDLIDEVYCNYLGTYTRPENEL